MDNVPVTQPVTKNNKTYGRLLLTFIALILAVIALIGVFWVWKHNNDLVAAVKQLQQTSVTARDQVTDLQQRLMSSQSQLQLQQQTLNDTQLSLQRVIHQTDNGAEAGLISEVDYLLRLANLQLQIGHDVRAAVLLLQSSEQRIQMAGDPSLLPLRQAIVNDVVMLQSLPNIDHEGILLRLNALRQQLDQLSVVAPNQKATTENNATTANANVSSWRKALRESLVGLRHIVIVTNRDQRTLPLPTPDQEFYLHLEMNFLVTQAQWAVLNNNFAIYKNSLQRLQTLVKQYFPGNGMVMLPAIATLDELQKINLQESLPEITKTLDLLRQVSAQKVMKSNSPGSK